MEESKRDFFISYNSADQRWAEWVAWQLEEEQFTVYIQAWDFLPGENFVLEMQEAVQQTRTTIALLSREYLAAKFTKVEWAAAFARDPEGKERALIPIRVRECQPTGLLATLIYIDIVGLAEEQARARILQYLQEENRSKPSLAPVFPDDYNASTAPAYQRIAPEPVAFPVSGWRQRVRENQRLLRKLGVGVVALLLLGIVGFFLLRASLEVQSDPGTLVLLEGHLLGNTNQDGWLTARTLRFGQRVVKLVNGTEEYQTERQFLPFQAARIRHLLLPSPLPQLAERSGLWRKWQDGATLPVELHANKRLAVSTPQVIYASDWNYYDYELRFHLRLATDAGAAWVWRMEDENNYYFCVLSGPQTKAPGLYLYVVREGEFNPAQPEDKAPDNPALFCHLRAQREYEVRLSVKTQQEQGVKTDQIEVCLIPAVYEEDDASCQPRVGEPVALGILRTKRVYFPSGSLGFRTLASEQFSVSSVLVLALQEQPCAGTGAPVH